jgi:hypothetical protein
VRLIRELARSVALGAFLLAVFQVFVHPDGAAEAALPYLCVSVVTSLLSIAWRDED